MLITFFFKHQIINKIQTGILKNIGVFHFAPKIHHPAYNSAYYNHKIFSLNGVEKIFPHRVNSMERFQYLYNEFSGFECDIIIDPVHNVFYIAHDPEGISSLTWDHLLEKDGQKKMFWLDVKNLTVENAGSFYRHIDLLDDKYDIKNRIIIESGNPVPLKQIADSGYLTSLYFPVIDSSNTLYSDSSVSLYIANTGGLISQDVFWLNLMNKNYPDKKKMIWDISFCTSLNSDLLKKYIADTTVLLSLINVKSPGYK